MSKSTPAPKPVARAPAKRTTKPPKAVAPAARPYLRFHHSDELRAKTIEVLEAVEGAEDATACSGQLTELVLELTRCGMDQFFVQSLKAANANFVVQQSAQLGMAGVHKLLGTVIRNILGRMDGKQVLSICGSIRGFMN